MVEQLFNATATFTVTTSAVDPDTGIITPAKETTITSRCRFSCKYKMVALNTGVTTTQQNYTLLLPPTISLPHAGYTVVVTLDNGKAYSCVNTGLPLYYTTHIEIPIQGSPTNV